MIFVEHDMDMVFDISDWVVVMAEGRVIAEGTPEQVGANQAVIDAYLGSHHDAELDADRARRSAGSRSAVETGHVDEEAA